MIKNQSIKKKAFTLAEVLVTLAVIGIVAALTIPSLLKNYQEKHLRTSCKEAYSIITQAVKKMQADNGDFSYYMGNIKSFKPVFMQYFSVIKDGNWNDFSSGLTSSIYKEYSETQAMGNFPLGYGQFVINNGMTLFIMDGFADKIWISADTNGHENKPNIYGKDLFTFYLYPNGELKPGGAQGTSYTGTNTYCSKTFTLDYNGISCAYYVMTDQDY